MPKCNGCNKFASIEENDPELDGLEIDDDGHISGQLHIVNSSSCCGEDMTEAYIDVEAETPGASEHVEKKGEHELSVEEDSSGERATKTEGRGRYAKTFYGAWYTVKVTCSCGKFEADVELEGFEQASAMDSLG